VKVILRPRSVSHYVSVSGTQLGPMTSLSFLFPWNYHYTVVSFLLWGTLSEERTGLSSAVAAEPCQALPLYWILRVSWCVKPDLTRGRVCNVLYNCFWALPEQLLLGQSPAELTAIFYCLFWDSPNIEGHIPVFITPQNRLSCTPGHRGSVLQYFLLHFVSNSIQPKLFFTFWGHGATVEILSC
jgi:hypothetical protein